jgi:hypothetical protein
LRADLELDRLLGRDLCIYDFTWVKAYSNIYRI